MKTKPGETKPQPTPEELMQPYIERAAEISKTLNGVKVYPIVFTRKATGEVVVGYVQEPKRQAKYAAIDELLKSASNAGELLLQSSLLKDYSDSRMYSDLSENDDIVISAALECLKFIQAYSNQVKKN